MADRLGAIGNVDAVQLGFSFTLLNSANPWMSIYYGVDERDSLNFCVLVFAALLAWIYQRRNGSRQPA